VKYIGLHCENIFLVTNDYFYINNRQVSVTAAYTAAKWTAVVMVDAVTSRTNDMTSATQVARMNLCATVRELVSQDYSVTKVR